MPHATPPNYRLGSLYALLTAVLFATQEPFSFLAAKRLNALQFVCLTQIALLISIPLLTSRPASRRDFFALITDASNLGKLAVIFAIGMSGLLLYNAGLSNAHPVIISAILNLTPFWAAGVALFISKVPIPVSPAVFFGCFAGAFVGAMAVPWSQIGEGARPTLSELADNLAHGSWVYAIPVPLCTALGATLIGRWFAKYEEFGRDRRELSLRQRDPDPHHPFHFAPALGAGVRRPDHGDHSHDHRHDHRRIGGTRLLSDRDDDHRRR